MPYTSIPFENFGGGLNLTAQSEVAKEQNQALDLLNVTFTRLSAVRQRSGFVKFTSSPGVNRYDSLAPFYKTDGTKQVLAGAGSRLEALSTTGAVIASMTGLTQGPWDFARFGTPTAELAFAGNGLDTIRRWDGSNWTSPSASTGASATTLVAGTSMPKGAYLAVTGIDNRLVVTGFQTTTGGPNNLPTSPSHVYFSEPGAPDQFLNNSYIQLRPGDGEKIMGCISWGDFTFFFKESGIWVYYGTSTDSGGNPIFNYRPIAVGVGAISPQAIVAGDDGVYFLSRNGVYRTTGQAPELVSASLEPFFKNDPAPYFASQSINPSALSQCSMAWHRNQLFLAVPTGSSPSNDRVFVFDPRYKSWTLYDFKCAAMASVRVGAQEELLFAYAAGSNDIGQHGPGYLTDAGAPIDSRWSSGWLDFGSADAKTIREWKLWASGKLQIGLATDFEALNNTQQLDLVSNLDVWAAGDNPFDTWGDGSDEGATWGSGATAAPALVRYAHRGTVFSIQISGMDGSPWEVQRLALHLREVRPPSVIEG